MLLGFVFGGQWRNVTKLLIIIQCVLLIDQILLLDTYRVPLSFAARTLFAHFYLYK